MFVSKHVLKDNILQDCIFSSVAILLWLIAFKAGVIFTNRGPIGFVECAKLFVLYKAF